MTCIVGFVDKIKNKVFIGGDSAGVSGYDLTVRADEKVFKNGEYIFGFTSSFRMGQLLRYAFEPPTPKEDKDINKFMCTTFIDAVRDCLKKGGYAERDKEVETGGCFLVGYKGHLFKIQSDYQVAIPRNGYDACGCGDQVANGALYAANKWLEHEGNLYPEQIVIMALKASECFSAGVRGPFTTIDEDGKLYEEG